MPQTIRYAPHPSIAHWNAMLESLESRTGKNLNAWLAALKKSQATTPDTIKTYLKSQNLGASTISLILDSALGHVPNQQDPQTLVDQLFKGPKAALLPLYETVLHFALGLAPDVKACPCATMVPLYRNHVFAQLKPSAKTRLDLGLALGPVKLTAAQAGRLIDTGGLAKKDRITHRLELTEPADFNDFATAWLTRAYQRDS